MDSKDNTFFTFRLGDGLFAMPIASVREVMNYAPITFVPNTKPYLKGVMNIRGSVISVIDFRTLFEIPVHEDISKSSIIVTEVPQENEAPMPLAIIVDSVDVVTPLEFIKAENVAYGVMQNRKDFIQAVARFNDDFVLLLDLKKIVDSVENELASED